MTKDDATLEEIERFYDLLDKLEPKNGELPETGVSGVYFIFEDREKRKGSGTGDRVVYVGTSTTLGQRLRFHLSGDRTNSSFRNIVGNALERRDRKGKGDLRAGALRCAIKDHINTTRFLWVGAGDQSGRKFIDGSERKFSERKFIERNAIGFLSTSGCKEADPASKLWLGRYSDPKRRGIEYGLWNSDHVGKPFDSDFLDTLDHYINKHINSTTRP